MTKHDRQMLWRTYERLLPYQKTAMRLLALIGDQIPRGTFVQALAASRTRVPDGKSWSNRSAEALLLALRAQGLVDKDLTCVGSIAHQVALDAAESEQGPLIVGALARVLPRSHRERPDNFFWNYHSYELVNDRDLFRKVRLAVYANADDEFTRLRQIFDREKREDGQAIPKDKEEDEKHEGHDKEAHKESVEEHGHHGHEKGAHEEREADHEEHG